jgi:hypothetical protein
MAATRISDLIIPAVVVPNILEKSLSSNRLVTSGLISLNPSTSAKLAQGGLTFGINTLRPIADTAGDPNVSTDDPTQFAVPKKIASRSMTGVRLEFNDSFAAMDVTESVTGVDATNFVISQASDLVTTWRAKSLFSVLKGVINKTVSPTLVNAINLETSAGQTAANKYSAGALLDTMSIWGDAASDEKVFLVMNSRMKRQLQAAEINNFVPASKTDINFPTYMGMPYVVDDAAAVDRAGTTSGIVATMYVVRAGAIEFAYAPVQNALELTREPLAGFGGGETIVVMRDAFSYHINGTKWVGSAANTHPTFAELATPANWQKVYADKNMGVAALTFNV